MNMSNNRRMVWLSYPMSPYTPAYNGGQSLGFTPVKCMDSGDHCNSANLTMPNHLGTHVDAPKHFVKNGMSVDDYEPADWQFLRPTLVDVRDKDCEVLTPDMLALSGNINNETDLLLIRTGFGAYRGQERYWAQQFPYHPSLADFLIDSFPNLKAIGVDTISISSPKNRPFGHEVHRRLLGNNIRIFEDLKLNDLDDAALVSVLALPLRVVGIDGAPCTVVGWVK